MSTFSHQNQLPALPVPSLKETLAKYLKSASALLNENEIKKLSIEIEKFEKSELSKQLQSALENRSKTYKNWLDNWWYDAYNDIRAPLSPFVSFGAINSVYKPINGGQLSRASDIIFNWLSVWDKIRNEKWPITISRGIKWDMTQFHSLFSSNRTPHYLKDTIDRYFKTKNEGETPIHIVICCNGVFWKINILNDDGSIKNEDQLYSILKFVKENSDHHQKYCINKLTTTNRDKWAANREILQRISSKNFENLKEIESSILLVTLTSKNGGNVEEMEQNCLLDESWFIWQDKSINIVIHEDGQVHLQGDHSNIDAIVLLQVGDYVGNKVRKELWNPTKIEKIQKPIRLDFEINLAIEHAIAKAEAEFYQNKQKYRGKAFHYHKYGNDLCRNSKIYTDTIVQIALQLAFLKTHGCFAPIYETASTRKFYRGRTETVRGCTPELVQFATALIENKKENNLFKLFHDAVNAHNQLMADCMNGNGFDRHLMGLKKTLEIMNKGCGPKRSLPSFFHDETWKRLGGDGNFLLSTSFIGYMNGNEIGTYGYVAAMRPNGYGCFYRIGKNRITINVSDWTSTLSNIDSFGKNIIWALDNLSEFIKNKETTKSKI